MQAFLEHQNLWKAVMAPPGGAITVDEETLRKARTEILLSVSKNVRIQIKNENSAESMWKKLKTLYDPDTSCKKIDTLREFCTTKLEDFDSEEDYVTKITELAHKLNSNKIEI